MRDPREHFSRAPRPHVDFAEQVDDARRPDGRSRARGHRRDRDRERGGRSFHERLNAALVDVGVHRVVAYRDLVDAQFDGHPYSGRRGIDRLKHAGLLQERDVAGPKGGSFRVLVATPGGARVAESVVGRHGFDPAQKAWAGLGREGDASHDVAVYRAVLEARRQIAEHGATVRRVRLDAELRGEVASRSEAERVRRGKAAADQERRRAAAELDLPIQPNGRVAYPDAQIEYQLAAADHSDEPSTGRINVEVASEHYRTGHIQSKVAAGFAVYAANGRAGRVMSKARLEPAARALGRRDDGGGAGSGKGRDSASVEL